MNKTDKVLYKIVGKSKFLERVRFYIKNQIINSESLYLPYSRFKSPDFTVDKNSDITIEGFMRSGNTFAYYQFKDANKNLNIAHHRHSNTQITFSVRNKIPTLLLIRNPIDVIVSTYIFFDKKIPEKQIAKSWIQFYRPLIKLREEIIISDFNNTINNFAKTVEQVNKFYKTEFCIPQLEDNKTFKIIKDNHTIPDVKRLAHPNKETRNQKQKVKEALIKDLKLRPILKECINIYETLLEV
jgi:hypothetical protein